MLIHGAFGSCLTLSLTQSVAWGMPRAMGTGWCMVEVVDTKAIMYPTKNYNCLLLYNTCEQKKIYIQCQPYSLTSFLLLLLPMAASTLRMKVVKVLMLVPLQCSDSLSDTLEWDANIIANQIQVSNQLPTKVLMFLANTAVGKNKALWEIEVKRAQMDCWSLWLAIL